MSEQGERIRDIKMSFSSVWAWCVLTRLMVTMATLRLLRTTARRSERSPPRTAAEKKLCKNERLTTLFRFSLNWCNFFFFKEHYILDTAQKWRSRPQDEDDSSSAGAQLGKTPPSDQFDLMTSHKSDFVPELKVKKDDPPATPVRLRVSSNSKKGVANNTRNYCGEKYFSSS